MNEEEKEVTTVDLVATATVTTTMRCREVNNSSFEAVHLPSNRNSISISSRKSNNISSINSNRRNSVRKSSSNNSSSNCNSSFRIRITSFISTPSTMRSFAGFAGSSTRSRRRSLRN